MQSLAGGFSQGKCCWTPGMSWRKPPFHTCIIDMSLHTVGWQGLWLTAVYSHVAGIASAGGGGADSQGCHQSACPG